MKIHTGFKILLASGFIVCLGVVGSMEKADQEKEAVLYCEMIEMGAWPAYNSSIDCANVHSANQ